MREEELARAFDDFYTTKQDGSGLGLSVVRRLTADLNGSLRVESEPGRGTTFTIELPTCTPS
jgi:signal transduction histidine kinase